MTISRTKNYMAVLFIAAALVAPTLQAGQTQTPETWTNTELRQAISGAKTADDHLKIAQYYKHDAARLDEEAKDHATMADLYRKTPTYDEQKHPMSARTAGHCNWLADKYAKMAQKEREMAKAHEDMAKSATK